MKPLAFALGALIVLLQYPLWFGKGGWLRVREVDHQLQEQRDANRKLQERNAALDADVRDLKQGFDAIEERARNELGMVKRDEIFFQVLDVPRSAGSNGH
ncbi:MAG TPA: cell division protein FtsB [Burkholderiales bacterium]|nr:cell division protein FtsB [Burkholderiales bacterium]